MIHRPHIFLKTIAVIAGVVSLFLVGVYGLTHISRTYASSHAPTSLTLTALSACTIKIDWSPYDPVSGSTWFEIEGKKPSGAIFTPFLVQSLNTVIKYPDITTLGNSTYKFRIRTKNFGTPPSTSSYYLSSDYKTVTTLLFPPPPTPPVVTSASYDASAGGVVVSWTGATPSVYGGFEVWRSDGDKTSWNFQTTTTSFSYTDPSATTSVPHFYKIIAYETQEGCHLIMSYQKTTDLAPQTVFSPDSNILAVPAKPSTLNVTTTGTNTLDLDWTDSVVGGADGNENFFEIEAQWGTNSFVFWDTASRDVTTYIATVPFDGKTYAFQIRATLDNDGDGTPDAFSDYSNSDSDTTFLKSPDAFQAIAVYLDTTLLTGEVLLSWGDLSSDNTTYEIERSTDNFTTAGLSVTCTFALGFISTDCGDTTPLPLGKIYHYRIRASNGTIYSDPWVYTSIDLNVSPMRGWAWSDNIGWISFDSVTALASKKYLVYVNNSTGDLSGYAWSDNMGWLNFDGGHIVLIT